VLCGSLASRRYRGIHDDIGKQELRFISRQKLLEGILLPESPPRVLRDPPFMQCRVTQPPLEVFLTFHKQCRSLLINQDLFIGRESMERTSTVTMGVISNEKSRKRMRRGGTLPDVQ